MDKGISDHAPIACILYPLSVRGLTPFRFFNSWAQCEGFMEVVNNSWNTSVSGSPIFQFKNKLKLVKKALIKWKDQINPNANLKPLRAELENLNLKLQEDHSILHSRNDKHC